MENTISEITALWDRVLVRIKERMNDQNDQMVFDSFFGDSYIDSIKDGQMVVVVNSGLAAEILSSKYKDLVNQSILEVTETNYEVVFTQKEKLQKTQDIKPIKPAYFSDSILNKNFTFKNFVVGPSN